jgi:anti-anti-sigma factor
VTARSHAASSGRHATKSLTERRADMSRDLASSAEQRRSALFAVEVTTKDRETVLTLHGELDLWTQPQFVSALAGIDVRVSCLVLDLSDLMFIDAASIREIYRARKRARMRGGDLVLRSPRPHLSRILELTGRSADSSGDAELRPIALPLPSRAYVRAST